MAQHKQACVEDRAGRAMSEVMSFVTDFRIDLGSPQYYHKLMNYGLNYLKDMSDDEITRLAKDDLGMEKKSDVKKFVKACRVLKNDEFIPVTENDLWRLKNDEYIPAFHRLGSLAVAVTAESDFNNKLINRSRATLTMRKQFRAYGIDVESAMAKLGTYNISLIYAARDGINCNEHMFALLGKHAGMANDLWVASCSFVDSSLTALQYHKSALVLAKKGKAADALTLLVKCAEVAKEMSNVADGLTVRARELTCHACTALSSTIDEADRKNPEGESTKYAKYGRFCLSEDSLDEVIKTLKIVMQSLFQITITFDKTKTFWKEVEKLHNNMKNVLDVLDANAMIEKIEMSAFNWFVLGRMKYQAKKKSLDALVKLRREKTNREYWGFPPF